MIETKYKDIYIDGEDIYKCKTHKLCKWIDNLGYYMVSFRVNGKKKYIRVHRIIALTLIPNPYNLSQVNHIDGNKLNNNIDNLLWCSNSYNTKHGYDNNLYHSKHRANSIIAINKNTNEKYIFKSIRLCASKLCINRKTITSILKGFKTTNNYLYEFQYLESVSTIPDECKEVDSEISTESKLEAAS